MKRYYVEHNETSLELLVKNISQAKSGIENAVDLSSKKYMDEYGIDRKFQVILRKIEKDLEDVLEYAEDAYSGSGGGLGLF